MRQYEDITARLSALAEEKYRDFSASLTPGAENMLGVRLPALRGLAREIINDDWRAFLRDAPEDSYEMLMLKGLVTTGAKVESLAEREQYIDLYVPKINNWALCDSPFMSLRLPERNRQAFLTYLQTYLSDPREFYARTGLVCLMKYTRPETAQDIFDALDGLQSAGYYAKMAAAWLLCECIIKLRDPAFAYLKASKLDAFTFNKALQKAVESYRVTDADKTLLRSMKKRERAG